MLKRFQHDLCMETKHSGHSTLAEFTLHQRNRSLNGAAYSQIAGIKQ
jgi:hypothetical protein